MTSRDRIRIGVAGLGAVAQAVHLLADPAIIHLVSHQG
jgi:hypothetical protein